ncbi:hypothetical protein NQ317_017656 [Molorchus minor]|uniref:Uncharacterized protein n=1 Tax=Molorchus minor TaxID=1323400 RepID=A0ABQ9JWG3_9CUCU|nr:hypothetical protein NQ317_017656 [Molorchus minor]
MFRSRTKIYKVIHWRWFNGMKNEGKNAANELKDMRLNIKGRAATVGVFLLAFRSAHRHSREEEIFAISPFNMFSPN